MKRAVGAGAFLLCVLAARWPSRAFCEQPFREIAPFAACIVVAEYHKVRGAAPELEVREVLHGEPVATSVHVPESLLASYRPRQGSRFLLALNGRGRPLVDLEHIGVCRPVFAVPLRGGRLRGDDRFAYYDNGDEALTLDELRADLAQALEGR